MFHVAFYWRPRGQAHAHTHTDMQTKTISRNQVFAAKGRIPGLNSSEYCMAELAIKHYVATYNIVLLI